MIRIEPLGTGIVLPAVAVGYEIASIEQDQQVEGFDESPGYIITLDQQAGGYCMRYPSVVGVVLRLADNPNRCRGDLDYVVRGFRAMAEDPDVTLLRREYPVLHELVYTRGEDYTDRQLEQLARFLAQFFDVPAFESGCEAFVRFERCDVCSVFGGWRAMQVAPSPDLRRLYPGLQAVHVDDSNIHGVTFSADTMFGLATRNEIEAIGTRIGAEGPRAFLLWENSD